MRTVNMHEAETHLSRLVQEAADGDPFVITRDGTPLVKVIPVEATRLTSTDRTGFMAGEVAVPSDFDRIGSEEIEATFEGSD